MSIENRFSGLLKDEKEVADLLAQAWEAFFTLPVLHENDREDFCRKIRELQSMVGMRHMRRVFPDYWENSEGLSKKDRPGTVLYKKLDKE